MRPDQLAIDMGWPQPASDARLSPCGTYRYSLKRIWDPTCPLLGWVMLNPSTADASADDPTIRRCTGFARKFGYGGIIVRNLYALRSTAPSAIDNHPDPIGPENDRELTRCCEQPVTVMAWGAFAPRKRAHTVARLLWESYTLRPDFGRLAVLGWTASGMPRHPLYMPGWTASGMPRHPLYMPGRTELEFCDEGELFDV